MRKGLAAGALARLALALAVYAIFASSLPNYHTAVGVWALLDGSVLTGLVAVGVGLTMIAGELDLSVASMAALAGVLTMRLIGVGAVPAVAVAVAVVAAALFGAAQGYLISWLRINSLVFTVGTLIGLRGVALVAANETTLTLPLDQLSITDAVDGRLFVFSPLSATMLGAFALAGLFASRTIWGREIYAIGGGRAESRAAGVPQRRPIVVAFAACAAFAALAGGLMSIRSGSASPLSFDAALLEAVAACLIGGVALEGGKGGFFGVLMGLFTLRLVLSGIASLGAPFWAQNLAAGLLLIFVIVVETASAAVGRWRERAGARAAIADRGA
ncbi:MAG TPA: ABC transporter permease [Roseiarcus sp.]|nr:ABC transporter permease [Roseiarcus sp.]